VIGRRTWLLGASALAVAGARGPVSAQSTVPVRIATTAAETYAQPFYAQEAGLFAKAGINVEVLILANGAAGSTAVAGGAADVGVTSTVTLGNAVVRGVPFVAIAPCAVTTAEAPSGLLCVPKSSIAKVAKDFEGLTIAVPALKQSGDLALRTWLAQGGVDAGKVRIIEVPFNAMGDGLERGLFAAAYISDPALTNVLRKYDVRRFADVTAAIGPKSMVAAWFTTRAYLQANPDPVRRVAAALTEAAKWANAHHNESAAIVSRIAKIDLDVIHSETRTVYGEQLSAADLQPQLDAAYKVGFLTRAVKAGEFLPR
jgi:NitT/TauT family transport system substrate-binding protein